MDGAHFRHAITRCESHLYLQSGLALLMSVWIVITVSGPSLSGIPEMIIPLAVSVGLGAFTYRITSRNYGSDCTEKMAKYGWIGALIAAAVSGWWIVLHVAYEMPFVGLVEQVATLVTGGIAIGMVVGYSQSNTMSSVHPRQRDHLVAEAAWTGRSGQEPIVETIVEALAELKGADPLDLKPIYDDVDPTIFTELQRHQGVPWQVWYHTDQYEFCVDGSGTVTIFDQSPREDYSPTILFDHDADHESPVSR